MSKIIEFSKNRMIERTPQENEEISIKTENFLAKLLDPHKKKNIEGTRILKASKDAQFVAQESFKEHTVGSLKDLINNANDIMIQTHPVFFKCALLSLKKAIREFYEDESRNVKNIDDKQICIENNIEYTHDDLRQKMKMLNTQK